MLQSSVEREIGSHFCAKQSAPQRTPGDEASAALATAHLVSWLIGKAWSIPDRALAGAVQTVERWNAALATRNLIVIPATSVCCSCPAAT